MMMTIDDPICVSDKPLLSEAVDDDDDIILVVDDWWR